jgi:hypothetical protein
MGSKTTYYRRLSYASRLEAQGFARFTAFLPAFSDNFNAINANAMQLVR